MGSSERRDRQENWSEMVRKTVLGGEPFQPLRQGQQEGPRQFAARKFRAVVFERRYFSSLIAAFFLLACTPRAPASGGSVETVAVANLTPAHLAPYAENAGATFVGAEVCVACHTEAVEVWRTSAHAHARDTLRAASAGSNPDCLPCHVTGMGELSGWTGAQTPALEHVTCEACHGPGSGHLDAITAESPDATPFRYGQLPLSAMACTGCHSATNSPDFRFAEYWAKVRH